MVSVYANYKLCSHEIQCVYQKPLHHVCLLYCLVFQCMIVNYEKIRRQHNIVSNKYVVLI